MPEQPSHHAAAVPADHEDAVVARAIEGDERARAEITDRCRAKVHAWCAEILADPELAEDATQEALLLAWQHIGALREPRAFNSWLYRITLNACRRQVGRGGGGQPGPSAGGDCGVGERSARGAPTPEDLAVARLEIDWILSRLRSGDRDILCLRYGRQWSSRDIAQKLGISEGAVRTRLHAIVHWVRGRAGSRGPED